MEEQEQQEEQKENQDLYRLLQLDPGAYPDVIEGAYRALSYVYHPDRNADPAVADKFDDVTHAYEVLSDPSRRAAYDRQRAKQSAVRAIFGVTARGRLGALSVLVKAAPLVIYAALAFTIIGGIQGVGPASGLLPTIPSFGQGDIDSIVGGIVGQIPTVDERFSALTPTAVPLTEAPVAPQGAAATETLWDSGCERASSDDQAKLRQDVEAHGGAVKSSPDNPEAHFKLAEAQFGLCQYELAIEAFDEAVRLDTDYGEAYKKRATAYGRLGQAKRTVEDISQAIRLDPNDGWAHAYRALAYTSLGQDEEARKDIEMAVELGYVSDALEREVAELKAKR